MGMGVDSFCVRYGMVWFVLFRVCIRLLLRFPFDGSGSLFGGGERGRNWISRGESEAEKVGLPIVVGERASLRWIYFSVICSLFCCCVCVGDTYLFASGVLGISLGL